MTSRIADLAEWAATAEPTPADVALARRCLTDTVAVTLAAHDEPIVAQTLGLPPALRWAAVGHVLDFDDVHLPSTSHVSVVCVYAALAAGGGAKEFLAAAGVMARLGTALGWNHYSRGWHTTCTAGAVAAAVAAGLSLGLDTETLAAAMALSIPGAGGVQRAFGTSAKALQVGFATEAGVRAARLAGAGASADPAALDQWYELVGGSGRPELVGPMVPGGLAVKLHPCCYALQRPIGAVRALGLDGTAEVTSIQVITPQSAVQPLIDRLPRTGLEGKFSLEYAVVAALLDGFPDTASFTDAAVQRPEARALLERVEVVLEPGGDGVLAGQTRLVVRRGGNRVEASADLPQGHPAHPADDAELAAKVAGCVGADRAAAILDLDWPEAAAVLHRSLPDRWPAVHPSWV